MKHYDVLVIGAGTGLEVVSYAAQHGMSVALVEEGPMGGTCLNRGCIPSKMLIHSADVAQTIKDSKKFGITASIDAIDFPAIVKRVSETVDHDALEIEEGLKRAGNVALYKTRGKFVGPKTMDVSGERIKAEKVFIVAGTRPTVPSIAGIENVPYLTSDQALRLTQQPKHLVIVGGGYIACELAHFFIALGTNVTVLVRKDTLLREEDGEIAAWFTKAFAEQHRVLFHAEPESVSGSAGNITVKIKNTDKSLTCDQLLVATGRQSMTDVLDIGATNVETNNKGFIKVNDYLETNVPGIWALGDVVGILPFKHTVNHQSNYVIQNAFLGQKVPVNYHVIAHAVFSAPQVAGVGKTEEQLKKDSMPYRVGRYEYKDTGMGMALQKNGLVKVLAGDNDTILGCHIVGPDAATLIHEVAVAMKTTGKVDAITHTVHVHPALSEVVQRAFFTLE